MSRTFYSYHSYHGIYYSIQGMYANIEHHVILNDHRADSARMLQVKTLD